MIFKLAELKIIEYDTGELKWERHSGLGACQEGCCFKKGAILFIGPTEKTTPGFLKLEFVNHLSRLPEWKETKYYCTQLNVYHSDSDKIVSKKEMRLWRFDQALDDRRNPLSDNQKNRWGENTSRESAYRLWQKEITIKGNGQIAWRSYSGSTNDRSGDCIILEDILFFGTMRTEESNFSKQEFQKKLKMLPKWDHTKYFSPNMAIHECISKVTDYKHIKSDFKARHKIYLY